MMSLIFTKEQEKTKLKVTPIDQATVVPVVKTLTDGSVLKLSLNDVVSAEKQSITLTEYEAKQLAKFIHMVLK